MDEPSENGRGTGLHSGFDEIKLLVPEDLCRAFQRCIWMQINETGRDKLDIMEEVVRDFLIKHSC